MKKIVPVLLSVIIAVGFVRPVTADKLEEYQQENYYIKDEIDKTLDEKNRTEQERSYLESLKGNMEQKEEKQIQIQQKMVSDYKDIEEICEDIDKQRMESQRQYEKSVEDLRQRLKMMYEKSTVSILDILFESKNLMDFLQRIDLMRAMAKANSQFIERLRIIKRDIEFKSAFKEEEKIATSSMIAEKEDRIETIRTSRSDIENNLRVKKTELLNLEKQLDSLYQKSREITSMIKKLQSQQQYAGGEMAWPVPSCYRVVSPFGMRLHPILGKYRMHTGVDINGRYGASIVAANTGTVIYSGWQSGYGYTVIIDHGVSSGKGISTLYAHCSSILVRTGQGVKKGQIIAKIGSTGLSTGPHLHFEVRENGEPVNPINNRYLKKNSG